MVAVRQLQRHSFMLILADDTAQKYVTVSVCVFGQLHRLPVCIDHIKRHTCQIQPGLISFLLHVAAEQQMYRQHPILCCRRRYVDNDNDKTRLVRRLKDLHNYTAALQRHERRSSRWTGRHHGSRIDDNVNRSARCLFTQCRKRCAKILL